MRLEERGERLVALAELPVGRDAGVVLVRFVTALAEPGAEGFVAWVEGLPGGKRLPGKLKLSLLDKNHPFSGK